MNLNIIPLRVIFTLCIKFVPIMCIIHHLINCRHLLICTWVWTINWSYYLSNIALQGPDPHSKLLHCSPVYLSISLLPCSSLPMLKRHDHWMLWRPVMMVKKLTLFQRAYGQIYPPAALPWDQTPRSCCWWEESSGPWQTPFLHCRPLNQGTIWLRVWWLWSCRQVAERSAQVCLYCHWPPIQRCII